MTFSSLFSVAPYGLRILPDNLPVEMKEGEDLQPRQCFAECEPSCEYSWHIGSEDGDVVEESSLLTLRNVSREYHGPFFCKAVNGIGDPAHDSFDLVVFCEFCTRPFHFDFSGVCFLRWSRDCGV